MIKYFLKDNFCLFIYRGSVVFHSGPVAFHSGPVAFHSGPDAKKRPAVKAVLANQIAPFSWIKNKLRLWYNFLIVGLAYVILISVFILISTLFTTMR